MKSIIKETDSGKKDKWERPIIYFSKITYDPKTKEILKIDCSCPDTLFRKIKSVGSLMDKKYYADPCKHTKKIVEALISTGYKRRIPKEESGPEILTAKIRNTILELAGNKCQMNGCEETQRLEIHRYKRGNKKGYYSTTNCMVLCRDCHWKKIHSGEFK